MLAGLLQVHQGQVGPVDPDPAPPPLPGGAAEVTRFFMDVPQWLQIGGVVLGGIGAVVALVLFWRHRKDILPWLIGLPAAVKATALAVLVAGGAAASVAGYQVYDFVEHDNRFCTGCHVMADAYLRFEESAHVGLGCKDCHAQPRTESARQLYLWVLQRPEEVGPHSPVPDARCTSCHIDDDPESQWPQIAASLGHRVHFESEDPELREVMCVSCHGVAVHQWTTAASTCGDCHEAEAHAQLGRMGAETELHCVACHDFMGEEPTDLPGAHEGMAILPDAPQCMACHDMEEILTLGDFDADPHGAVCGACHNPHEQDTPFDAVETCQGCHVDVETLTIFHTGTHAPVLPNCAECHSAHTWSVQGSQCQDCHDTVMDDPGSQAGILNGPGAAGWMTPEEGGASSGGPSVAASSMAGTGGAAAAFPHPPLAAWAHLALHETGPVVDLRAQPATGDTFPPTPDPRPFLHRQHESVSCQECHGSADEHGIVTVTTAQDCAACHHDSASAYECQSCHVEDALHIPRGISTPMSLTVWDEPRSRELGFEHGLHEDISCQECHTEGVLLAVEMECAACHEDHHRAEADCTRCHLPAADDAHGLEVHLTCTSSGCHAGTAGERPSLTRNLCLPCHADQRDHEPGLNCQDCHMVPEQPPVRSQVLGNREMG